MSKKPDLIMMREHIATCEQCFKKLQEIYDHASKGVKV